jgi:hypothetical protein
MLESVILLQTDLSVPCVNETRMQKFFFYSHKSNQVVESLLVSKYKMLCSTLYRAGSKTCLNRFGAMLWVVLYMLDLSGKERTRLNLLSQCHSFLAIEFVHMFRIHLLLDTLRSNHYRNESRGRRPLAVPTAKCRGHRHSRRLGEAEKRAVGTDKPSAQTNLCRRPPSA